MLQNSFTRDESRNLAANILKLLGGHKFIMMADVTKTRFGNGYLNFKFMHNSSLADHCLIRYNKREKCYKVTFYAVKNNRACVVKEFDGLLKYMIPMTFENFTKLACY